MAFATIDKGSKYFNTVLYTGTTATQSITGVGFKPDWVWLKSRGEAQDHYLFDINRTATKALSSDLTLAEQTYTDSLTSFDSDGFTLGASTRVNKSPYTHVSWNWLGANTTVSNTSGSRTSTVSANTTSGFSIVSFTTAASGASATVGHGLGVAPSMYILKQRTNASAWPVYHKSLGAGNYVSLNATTASGATDYFNSTSPTSTVFSIGPVGTRFDANEPIIAYCFAEIKGYSKFGSYTGNGSSDGTFVYTGFKPAFIMYKRSNAGTSDDAWVMIDTARDKYNVATQELYSNGSNAEGTASNNIDILSNGFKPRRTQTAINASGGNYIYMAFAENPFVSSKGIPTCAR